MAPPQQQQQQQKKVLWRYYDEREECVYVADAVRTWWFLAADEKTLNATIRNSGPTIQNIM